MKKELDMRLLNQITGGADEVGARNVLEPVFALDDVQVISLDITVTP